VYTCRQYLMRCWVSVMVLESKGYRR
jgi:hypothetical protein